MVLEAFIVVLVACLATEPGAQIRLSHALFLPYHNLQKKANVFFKKKLLPSVVAA
jgi:hypothetical protein